MAFALSPAAARAGYRLLAFDTVDSTSTQAMACARDGAAGPLWLVSDHQSAGLGRRGSVWYTARGNLAASLLLTPDLPPTTVATLGFVAGLALARALDAVWPEDSATVAEPCGSTPAIRLALDGERSPSDRFALKWPNDMMTADGKLAGILLGSEEIGHGRRAVVIGIGVNVASAPEGLPYPTTSLSALDCRSDAATLFGALSAAWAELYRVWDEGRGFDRIRKDWLARAAGLGGAVAVSTGGVVTRGVFETIDEHGQLVVRRPDGSARTVSAGEVHFGAAATVRPEVSS